MADFRAHFDFDIRFANGGDLSGTGFRLDLPAVPLLGAGIAEQLDLERGVGQFFR